MGAPTHFVRQSNVNVAFVHVPSHAARHETYADKHNDCKHRRNKHTHKHIDIASSCGMEKFSSSVRCCS